MDVGSLAKGSSCADDDDGHNDDDDDKEVNESLASARKIEKR